MIKTKQEVKKDEFGLDLKEMLKAGLHFGHRASKLHPKMEPFVYGVKKTVHIIDLEKTAQKLREALEFIRGLSREGKVLLFVGTKVQHKGLIEEIAKEYNLPYVTERWLGGTLTNFAVMKKRMDYLKEMEKKEKEGEFEKYTKKEQMQIEKELGGLQMKFGGIKALERLPDAVFVCDMIKDDLAVREARMNQIPVIAVCDTNADPTLVDYPIPANDDAISSTKYILGKVSEVLKGSENKKEETKKEE